MDHGRSRSLRAAARRCVWRTSCVVCLGAAAGACSDLLEVNDPDVITPTDLAGELGRDVIYAGGIIEFAFAWTGGSGASALVPMSGVFSDEFHDASFGYERIDRRIAGPEDGDVLFLYDQLHRARRMLEDAAESLASSSFTTESDPRIAELLSLAGFTYVGFGETYCSGVPFSSAPESGSFLLGEPKMTVEIFELAIQRFERALAGSAGEPDAEHLAHVGKGRALLNLGRFDEAAAEVADVPTAFVYQIEHSDNSFRERNAMYWQIFVTEWFSVADREGGAGLPFRNANDPRVPWRRDENGSDVGADGVTPQYDLMKYPGPSAPLVLADGIEARLIEAEALLNAGQSAEWLATLNQVRASLVMPPLADPGDQDVRLDLHFSERAFWMFATGHRLGDLRRLIRLYGRSPEAVFPGGAYFRGGNYMTDVNFAVPVQEQRNPNFSGCIDRSR